MAPEGAAGPLIFPAAVTPMDRLPPPPPPPELPPEVVLSMTFKFSLTCTGSDSFPSLLSAYTKAFVPPEYCDVPMPGCFFFLFWSAPDQMSHYFGLLPGILLEI